MDKVDCSEDDMLDVIVRLHDPKRIAELDRCMLSLVCQSYRPITINICTQRFTSDQLSFVQSQMEPLLQIDKNVKTRMLNFASEHPRDARSVLLNLGIRASSGRYLAFLDYDDVIFPNSYQTLIDELQSSNTAIAFGSINVKHVDRHGDFTITTGKSSPFSGADLRDLFRGNFCPIHSFVIDRSAISTAELHVDNSLIRAEDYDLIMRVCASYPSSFRLRRRAVGDYYYHNDGSNTVITTTQYDEENKNSWKLAEDFLTARRNITSVSLAVQRSLGVDLPNPKMTIRTFVDQPDNRSSRVGRK